MAHWKEGRKVFEAKLKWNLRWCEIKKTVLENDINILERNVFASF